MTGLMTRLGTRRARVLAGTLALAGLAALYVATAKHVTLVVDGHAQNITTHARTVAGVLREAGLSYTADDRLEPEPQSPLTDIQIVELTRANPVVVDGPGGVTRLMTAAVAPADILAAAGFRLYPGDRVWVDGALVDPMTSESDPRPSRLSFTTGREIEVNDNGSKRTIRTSAPTVGEALWEAGMALFEGDWVVPPETQALDGVTSITVERSHPVTIVADGRAFNTRAIASTVGGALAETGIALIGLDYTRPALADALPADTTIEVVRVEEQVELEEEPIPFDTTYQPIDDLEIDNQKVIDNGSYGVRANRVRVRLENGQETDRFVESDWVARQPEPRVIGYGTQIIPRSMNTDDGPIQYCRAVSMYATSYSPSRAGVSPDAKNFGITASGRPLRRGLVAIDRSLIPFGTRMYVPGYGFAEAADTGGGVKGRWIDLGYDDDNYVAWHQYVTVYFLCPLPGLAWIFP
jgi:uncharacterized protein YabE (DUF348 family)